jgi:hypothetical protein
MWWPANRGVARHMALVRVGVEPSLTAGFGVVVLSAVASGRSVIRVVASTWVHDPAPYSRLRRGVTQAGAGPVMRSWTQVLRRRNGQRPTARQSREIDWSRTEASRNLHVGATRGAAALTS